MVALATHERRDGAPVVGFGFSSIGRFVQGGLIRERFAPRLLAAREDELATPSGGALDPMRAWECMMAGDKPGGHGERSVAVGTLDMGALGRGGEAGWPAAPCLPGARLARAYASPIAAGEALFSLADARNLARHAGLRPDRDVLVFDPARCYGLPEYLRIVEARAGWPRAAFRPHGGHLFSLHVEAALGLGGSESNPHNFQPFGGFADEACVEDGRVRPQARRASASRRARPFATSSERASRPRRPSGCADASAGLRSVRKNQK